MSATIWKYPLTVEDVQSITMPIESVILTIQVQNEQPCLWALVDPEASKISATFRMFGTGHAVDAAPTSHLEYLGTFQILQGALVFHVFKETDVSL